MKPNWKPPKHVERMRNPEKRREKHVDNTQIWIDEFNLFPQSLIDAILAMDASIVQAFTKFAEMAECPRVTHEISIEDLKIKEEKE